MRILYLSCHSILEYEEVKMLHELGYNVFPAGAYINPTNPHDNKRPSIPGLELDPALLEQYGKLASPGVDSRDCLTKEFVNNFDTVIIMHLPRWAENNWNALKHKRVIWRTIGQSVASTEQTMAKFVNQGMQIVRYSPQEVCIPHFAGQDALIRFYKDPDQYGNWLGDKKQVITFAQNMKNRGSACNYSFFEEATRPFPRHLFGPGNEGESWTSGVVPYEQLKEELRRNRVYFYTGTHPASYTLNFMEAWMTGIPIVAIGQQRGNAEHLYNHNLYEIPYLIQNGENGFVSDDIDELRMYMNQLLKDDSLAKKISINGRNSAIRHFNKDMIAASWKEFLGE